MVRLPSRLVVAAPASGGGKTTVSTGLMSALAGRGLSVAPFKVGPDFVDPGYHCIATNRLSRNLDPVLCGEELIAPLFAHGAQGSDVAVVEGVMGLFDGQLGTRGFSSTAHVAGLIQAPVLLVVDIRSISRSVGAIVSGMDRFDPKVRIGGVVLNRVGSSRHEQEARDAVTELGIPVVGALPRDLGIPTPPKRPTAELRGSADRGDRSEECLGDRNSNSADERLSGALRVKRRGKPVAHGGLRSRAALSAEPLTHIPEQLAALGEAVAEHLDLDAILRLARGAPDVRCEPWDPASVVFPPSPRRPRVAVASNPQFAYRYPESDELLAAAGCEVVTFDPATATELPRDISGLWLGGGLPEATILEQSIHADLLADIRQCAANGLPTVAERTGLLLLSRSVDGQPMSGVLPVAAISKERSVLGYREAISEADNLLARVGERVTGHEFHRTVLDETGPLTGPDGLPSPAWELNGQPEGMATTSLHASYLHVHWAGNPQLAQRFAEAVHRREAGLEPGADSWVDLSHHGDKDLGPGLVDFAVNVRRPSTPPWLIRELTRDQDWASYPDDSAARAAIAAHHGLEESMVLPVAGAAEAFTLVARAIEGSALVVHPQFTEPEAALLAAGRQPRRHLLKPQDNFTLNPEAVPAADLLLIGNPTNPTGVLHPAASLLGLRAGVLVVDEAFLDAIPGQPESLIGPGMAGRLVLRSLTKTWAIAGIRAGYVVGDPTLIARLKAQQPPWSVSTPAAAAMVACLSQSATAEADQLAHQDAGFRSDLVRRLSDVGLPTVPGSAPFVLVDTSPISPDSLRGPLAARGFAVRRAETFPGLGPTWLRLAVRTPKQHRLLAEALGQIKEEL